MGHTTINCSYTLTTVKLRTRDCYFYNVAPPTLLLARNKRELFFLQRNS